MLQILLLLALALVALYWPWMLSALGRRLGWRCGAIGWIDQKPWQCQEHKYHLGSHTSHWAPRIVGGCPARERLRWFDGEYGQASSREVRSTLGFADEHPFNGYTR